MYHSSAAGLLGLAGAERTLVVAPEGAIAVAVIRPRNGGTDFKYLCLSRVLGNSISDLHSVAAPSIGPSRTAREGLPQVHHRGANRRRKELMMNTKFVLRRSPRSRGSRVALTACRVSALM